MTIFKLLTSRIVKSITTFPLGAKEWLHVGGITAVTTFTAGTVAVSTDFASLEDYNPPPSLFRPISAYIFPSLFEEIIWRGAMLPLPSNHYDGSCWKNTFPLNRIALLVLAAHVLSHPLAGATIWPRGRIVFNDPRFLLLATIVLGGATTSYVVSGGSVWAAAMTHSVPLILWRDYFDGEHKLQSN
jgi:predicted Abi (CAAX) family protease